MEALYTHALAMTSLRASATPTARQLRRARWAKAVYEARRAASFGLRPPRFNVHSDEPIPSIDQRYGAPGECSWHGDGDGDGDGSWGAHGDGRWEDRGRGYDDDGGHRSRQHQQRDEKQPEEGEAPPKPRGYKLGLKGEPALGSMHVSWRVRRVRGSRQHTILSKVLAAPAKRTEKRLWARRGVSMSHSRSYLCFDDDGNVVESKSCRVNKRALALAAEAEAKAAKAAAKNAARREGRLPRRKKRRRAHPGDDDEAGSDAAAKNDGGTTSAEGGQQTPVAGGAAGGAATGLGDTASPNPRASGTHHKRPRRHM